jgi:hypothetical protein
LAALETYRSRSVDDRAVRAQRWPVHLLIALPAAPRHMATVAAAAHCVTDEDAIRAEPMTLRAVRWRQDHPSAIAGLDEIADHGLDGSPRALGCRTARRTVRMMTDPDPLTETANRLNAPVNKEFVKIISEYERGLPITAAHVVEDKTITRVYWVSGGSLVTLNCTLEVVGDSNVVQAALATGRVRSLASAERVDIGAVLRGIGPVRGDVARTVTLHFDGEEPVIFPDPAASLADEIHRERVTKFLDALLRALDAR